MQLKGILSVLGFWSCFGLFFAGIVYAPKAMFALLMLGTIAGVSCAIYDLATTS
jgi:hypothetical protein